MDKQLIISIRCGNETCEVPKGHGEKCRFLDCSSEIGFYCKLFLETLILDRTRNLPWILRCKECMEAQNG